MSDSFPHFLTYSFQILSSLMMLSMVFVMITLANESAHRIVEVLKEESSLKNPAEPVYEVADGSIDFENVSFSYSKKAKRKSLADINLHIRSGRNDRDHRWNRFLEIIISAVDPASL